MGQASVNETNQIKQIFRSLLNLPPEHLLPPELPERRKPVGSLPSIPEGEVMKPGTSKTRNILPSASDIKRYEKYLPKKEGARKETKLQRT